MDDVATDTVFHSRSSSAGSGASGSGVLLSVAQLTACSPSSSVASSVEENADCCDGTHSAKPVIVSSKEAHKGAITGIKEKELEGMECTAENFDRLRMELAGAMESLLVKEKEIFNLSRIRENVEAELEELTASLFEEAHKMVRDANVKQASAERVLIEANMKIEGLETEVVALKTLVLTSTPAQPNVHLHPHIDPKRRGKSKDSESPKSLSPATSPAKGHTILVKRPSSNNGLENGSALSVNGGSAHNTLSPEMAEEQQEVKHFDPVLRKEYLSWHKSPTLDCSHPFLSRIYREDINPCLDFANASLAASVRDAIHGNALSIVPVKDFSNLPRNCALLDSPVLCRYLVRVGGDCSAEADDGSFFISQLSRNRITAVCDCVNYLRYIQQGLVKSHVNDVYWEIMNLRRKMSLARFGFSPE